MQVVHLLQKTVLILSSLPNQAVMSNHRASEQHFPERLQCVGSKHVPGGRGKLFQSFHFESGFVIKPLPSGILCSLITLLSPAAAPCPRKLTATRAF